MNKDKKEKINYTDIIVTAILGFIICIIPLIVRYAVVKISDAEINAVRGGIMNTGNATADMFVYCKSFLLITSVIIIVILLGLDLLTDYNGKKVYFKTPVMICAGIYGLFILLSAVFSSYKSIAFFGAANRYEGAAMLLCYIILFAVTLHNIKSIKRLNLFIVFFAVSAFLVGLVGAGQFFGFDIFSLKAVAKAVLGSYYGDITTLSARYENVYCTLYNPNYVGSFFGLMLPVFAVFALFLPLKSKLKYFSAVLVVICVINVIGCRSAGAFLGIICSGIVTLIAGIIYIVAKRKTFKISPAWAGFIAAAAVVGGGAAACMINADGMSAAKVKTIFSVLSGSVKQESPYFWQDMDVEGEYGVIEARGYKVKITLKGNEPVLIINDVEYSYTENNGEKDGWTVYEYDGLDFPAEVEVKVKDDMVDFAPDDGVTGFDFIFRKTGGGITAVAKNGDDYNIDSDVKTLGFNGLEYLGSGRGYIWSRSLPLLFKAKNFILGSGPDTFVMEFPYNDLRGKTKFLGNPYITVDKPHNMYLQIGINTGVFSLIAFGVLIIIYILSVIKAMLKDSDGCLNVIRLGLMAGILGYLFTNFTTDSNVSVAPLFWIMLGVGCVLNIKSLKRD